MLVDSHCHLNFPDFKEDLPEVIARAKASGVTIMQSICTRMSEFSEICTIAETYDGVYCSVGVHPNNVAEAPLVTVEELVATAVHPKVIGLGETGLDYHYDAPPELQKESFRRHIEASRQTALPVIVHTRDADEDTVALLKEEMAKGAFPALIHCFTSTQWLAEECIKLGLYISLSGILTFKNAKAIQEAAKGLPLERLLVETDAPYLAPAPYRGKRNEPEYTKYTNKFLADLKAENENHVAAVTTANFHRLFTKAKAA
jgi:TatD DNase family protein